ncbi:MAG: Hpt domain-containing protein, partial [Chitinophagaceae bacterium]
RESSDNLLVIINDILDFSKIKAGRLTLEQISFNPMEVMNKTIQSFKHKADEKGLTLGIYVDINIPASVTGDPYRLNQILVNLIGNSLKFTEKGEVRVEARLQQITNDQVFIEFCVIDTGIGIPEEKMSTIFDSFTQAGTDITRKYGGSGLGLSITKQLISLQKGKFKIKSKLNEGTTFRFLIPYHFTPSNIIDLSTPKDSSYMELIRGRSVLVAEDNIINQKVVFYTLQKAGLSSEMANNGKEAIAKLQSGKKYDIILMDIQMPELDGYKTTEYIRQILKSDIPIIAMTATALKGEREKCLGIGMNDYISKPFVPDDLFRGIAALLGNPSTPATELPTQKIQSPAYNLAYLDEMGDPEYTMEILQTFLHNTPSCFQEIQEEVKKENWTEVHFKAHKLKTSLGLLQMNEILELVTHIEKNAKSGKDLSGIADLVQSANSLYEKVHPLLEQERNQIPRDKNS